MKKPTKGYVVDGMTSGNPGPSKYRIFSLETNSIIYESDWIGVTTNNITEFLGLCHAIHLAIKNGVDVVYSDSVTAISWVNKRQVTSKCKNLQERVNNAIIFINSAMDGAVDVEKWHTVVWGENPADFGNKK